MLPAISNFLDSVPVCLHELVLRDFSDPEITNWKLSKKWGLSIVACAAMRNNFADIYFEVKKAELTLIEVDQTERASA